MAAVSYVTGIPSISTLGGASHSLLSLPISTVASSSSSRSSFLPLRPYRPPPCQPRALPRGTPVLAAVDLSLDYYEVLGVSRTADTVELKKAYRSLARQYHPDVSSEPDAQEKFIRLTAAYEVLADDELRKAYDIGGLEGLTRRPKHSADAVWDSWEEFQPVVRRSRKGDAREAAASGTSGGEKEEAQMGDVVEYPLSAAAQANHGDGRTKGVGLVVGRNLDRGDAHKLSPEYLEMVELEPLYCEEGSQDWHPDPLESVAFAAMSQLKVIKVEFDRPTDSWVLKEDLSPGCGSPRYEEEIYV